MKFLITALLLLCPNLVIAQDADIQPTNDPNTFEQTVVKTINLSDLKKENESLQSQIDVYQGKINELQGQIDGNNAVIQQAKESLVTPLDVRVDAPSVNWTDLNEIK